MHSKPYSLIQCFACRFALPEASDLLCANLDQQARTELNRAIIRNLGELVGFQAPITSMCWNNRFAIYSDPICQDSFSPYLRWLVCPFRCRLKILPEASRYAS
jgi:hypothetical protein